MRAGDLDRKITIEKPVTVQDSTGEEVKDWVVFATVPARVQGVSGRNKILNDQDVSLADVIFTIRYLPGLSVLMRIIYEGNEYRIHPFKELGRREGHEIPATLKVP